jgi:uncharacterized protein
MNSRLSVADRGDRFMTRLFLIARSALIVIVSIYLLAFVLLYVFQRKFIFHPDTQAVTPQQANLSGFESIRIGPGLRSWWHPPYLHGNGGALAGRAPIFSEMADWGAGVLAVGYPGYAGNAGVPAEATMHRAAQANYDWLRRNRIDPAKIVITAHSMGTGVAVPLAAQNPAAGLIIESPFTSLADVAQLMMSIFPVRHLIRDPFRSADHIAKVKMPIVWMHGTADQLIPYSMGEELFGMVKGPKCYLRIDGGDHDHLWGMGVAAFTKRQAFALANTGQCDGTPVRLVNGQLLPM